MTTPSKPAATVILIRPDLKILLMRRSKKASFFPSAWVFPGGRVDEADKNVSCYGEIDGLDHNHFAVAAIRESFEEAGIWFGLGKATTEFREGLNNRSQTMADAPHLEANLDRMELWSWWITPENEPKRYDTRFFICELTEEEAQNTQVDNNEMVEYQWLTAKEALEQHAANTLPLAPPTFVTLWEIHVQQGQTAAELMRHATNRRVEAIMPQHQKRILEETECLEILFPSHPNHQETTKNPYLKGTSVIFSNQQWNWC
jgi:8-oxo-dGTP pyrophosphatase MutT (NUDIX family)